MTTYRLQNLFKLLGTLLFFTLLVEATPFPVDHPLRPRMPPGCSEGGWQCSGSTLQMCYLGSWTTVEQCTGMGMICIVDGPLIGCVFYWQAWLAALESTSALSPASSSTTPSTLSSITPSLSSNSPSTPSSSIEDCDDEFSSTSPASIPTQIPDTSSSLDDCDDGPTSSPSPTQPPTASTSSLDDCDDEDTTVPTTPTSAGATLPSSTSSGNTTGNSNYTAPHYVIYADDWLTQPPDVSDLGKFNRFILAFWMISGPSDDCEMWVGLDASTRSSILDQYHKAGVAVMVSAFGSEDTPTTSGADATETAQKLAAFVKQYDLDGVDVDYEDFDAFDAGKGEAWIIEFHNELRSQLGPDLLISHAPVAPWFAESEYKSGGGGYTYIYQKCPDIDFFNVQFYNQDSLYTDCTSLITDVGTNTAYPGTSLLQLNSVCGVPLEKLVLGKPLLSDGAGSGYMSPSDLAPCVAQAEAKGWNGGVMFWEWESSSDPASILNTVLGG